MPEFTGANRINDGIYQKHEDIGTGKVTWTETASTKDQREMWKLTEKERNARISSLEDDVDRLAFEAGLLSDTTPEEFAKLSPEERRARRKALQVSEDALGLTGAGMENPYLEKRDNPYHSVSADAAKTLDLQENKWGKGKVKAEKRQTGTQEKTFPNGKTKEVPVFEYEKSYPVNSEHNRLTQYMQDLENPRTAEQRLFVAMRKLEQEERRRDGDFFASVEPGIQLNQNAPMFDDIWMRATPAPLHSLRFSQPEAGFEFARDTIGDRQKHVVDSAKEFQENPGIVTNSIALQVVPADDFFVNGMMDRDLQRRQRNMDEDPKKYAGEGGEKLKAAMHSMEKFMETGPYMPQHQRAIQEGTRIDDEPVQADPTRSNDGKLITLDHRRLCAVLESHHTPNSRDPNDPSLINKHTHVRVHTLNTQMLQQNPAKARALEQNWVKWTQFKKFANHVGGSTITVSAGEHANTNAQWTGLSQQQRDRLTALQIPNRYPGYQRTHLTGVQPGNEIEDA
ncbi:unnamed protein product [Amoebophrya sp. A120]|nr:unnamed protein product [Amoebophrya sp. A120]|eukprot:GSA120T00000844001.1